MISNTDLWFCFFIWLSIQIHWHIWKFSEITNILDIHVCLRWLISHQVFGLISKYLFKVRETTPWVTSASQIVPQAFQWSFDDIMWQRSQTHDTRHIHTSVRIRWLNMAGIQDAIFLVSWKSYNWFTQSLYHLESVGGEEKNPLLTKFFVHLNALCSGFF